MTSTRRLGRGLGALGALALSLSPTTASAQAPPLSESIAIGAWTFRPSFELRLRGEYRRDPIDVGGVIPETTAVLAEADAAPRPTTDPVTNQWRIAERARLGLAVDRGPVTGVLVLQDARSWGVAQDVGSGRGSADVFPAAGEPELPSFAPFEAYIDVHSRKGRPVFLRIGRQKIVWGEGRLLGVSDWSATARSFDGARFGFQVADIDIELLAALVSVPGTVVDSTSVNAAGETKVSTSDGTGSQLYGLHAAWHLVPLLNIEITGLGRIVREPHPRSLTPGDTFVIDARFSGDRRGLRYSLEGAYELGRVATVLDNRDLSAFAAAARVELETALPWHLTFGVQGAYASGDDGPLEPTATQHRFDPIFPEQHDNHGMMDLYAWSNLLEAGANIAARPADELHLGIGYRFVGLAEPKGQWTTAALTPVGSSPTNTSRILGHEIDATIGIIPWSPVRFDVGYGLFALGEGGKNIVRDAQRSASTLHHFGYLQATVRAP